MKNNNINQLFQLIDKLRENNYTTVTEDDRKKYRKLLAQCPNDKDFKNQLIMRLTNYSDENKLKNAPLENQINQRNDEISKNFNIAEHYRATANSMSSLNNQDIDGYFPDNLDLPKYKISLDCKALTGAVEMNDCAEKSQYLQQSNAMLQNIIQAKGQPNQTLAAINKETPIAFKILDSQEFDGQFDKNEFDKTGNIVIKVNSGCFIPENFDKLPMLISHECGHLIDIHQRYKTNPLSKDYHVSLKAQEEYLADTLGTSMCTNAGYNDSVTQFKNHLKTIKNPLLQQRAELINTNQLRIKQRNDKMASLSGRKPQKPNKPSIIQPAKTNGINKWTERSI